MTEVTNIDLQQFMVCAFRYSLERKTGILTDTLERIERYWKELSPTFKEQIRGDIRHHIERDKIDKHDMEACRRILAL